MKIFKIYGRFTQECNHGRNDFVGYFIQEDGSEQFIGYMVELYITKREDFKREDFQKNDINDPIRYIKGFYMKETKELVFLKLSNCKILDPIIYVFYNIEERGIWSGWSDINKKFFNPNSVNHRVKDIANGEAIVEIEKVTEKTQEYEKKIREIYEEVLEVGLQTNIELMNNMEEYKKFLNIRKHIIIDEN